MTSVAKVLIYKEVYKKPDGDYRVLGCKPLELLEGEEIILNKWENFTLAGKNLEKLKVNFEFVLEIEKTESEKYGTTYSLKSIKEFCGVSKEGEKVAIHDNLKLKLLSSYMTESQAENVLSAYPDFIEIILNGQEDELDYNKIYNVGPAYLKIYIDKIKKDFFSILFSDFCFKYGIEKDNEIDRLVLIYQDKEIIEKAIEENPYKVLIDVLRYRFQKADDIIQTNPNYTNKLTDSIIRLVYYLNDILLWAEIDSGDTKIDKNLLFSFVEEDLPELADCFEEALEKKEYFFVKDNWVSCRNTFNKEKQIAQFILNRIEDLNYFSLKDIQYFTQSDDFNLTDEQIEVLNKISENNVVLLCGSAGTGKSSTTKAIIKLLEHNEKSYTLLAPTGIAAKKLHESTGRPSSTIHRYLANEFRIYGDVLIIDEMSMVGVDLFYDLLEAVQDHTKILFICDNSQLASISCGNIVEDIINSKKVPIVTLTKVFRYSDGGIDTLATDIRNGKYDLQSLKQGNLIVESILDDPLDQLLEEYQKLLNEGFSKFETLILTPFNKLQYGAVAINKIIQEKYNNNESVGNGFKLGDKVICIKNEYKTVRWSNNPDGNARGTPIMNGDIGRIVNALSRPGETPEEIEKRGKDLIIDFDEDTIFWPRENIRNLRLGYAITIHKSQGSQSPAVIVLVDYQHKKLLTRNLLYVAVTRAQKKLVLLGEEDIIQDKIQIQENKERDTWLKDMLINYNEICNS